MGVFSPDAGGSERHVGRGAPREHHDEDRAWEPQPPHRCRTPPASPGWGGQILRSAPRSCQARRESATRRPASTLGIEHARGPRPPGRRAGRGARCARRAHADAGRARAGPEARAHDGRPARQGADHRAWPIRPSGAAGPSASPTSSPTCSSATGCPSTWTGGSASRSFWAAPWRTILPSLVVPPIVNRLRHETQNVILPGEEEDLRRYLAGATRARACA